MRCIERYSTSNALAMATLVLGVAFASFPVADSFVVPSVKYHPRIDKIESFDHISNTLSRTSLFQATKSVETLSERLKLGDHFDRWKFLQDVLDDFVADEDMHQVLYATLEGYPLDEKVNEAEGTAPTATPEQKDIVASLIQTCKSNFAIPAMTNADTLQQIEKLIPDPQEDEDGFKGSWDTVMELHGRELVKVNEQAGTERWKRLSIVARVLIHYDFLTDGLRLTEDS